MFRYNAIILLFFLVFGGCAANQDESIEVDRKAINAILDDWHKAASEANFDQYFNHFASDSAIFMGTDATERWTVTEFKSYAKPHFESGDAWDFTPIERHVYLSENRNTAWFDESLDTPNLGPARGSGVMISQNGNWKIAHYNLSIPIPNAIVDSMVNQVGRALEESKSE